MKPKLKVGFQHWTPDLDFMTSPFVRALSLKYEVVVTWPCDLLLFMCFSPPPYSGAIGRLMRGREFMEPGGRMPDLDWMVGDHAKAYITEERFAPDMSKCDLAFCHQPEDLVGHKHYHRMPFYAMSYFDKAVELTDRAGVCGDWEDWKKREFCEFVYSHKVKRREAFFGKLENYQRVSSPGRSCNNMPALGNTTDPLKSRHGDSWLEERLEFAQQHKFSIAYENNNIPGYVSEKIMTPFITGAIPIYWGCEEVKRDFNPSAFLHREDYGSDEEMVAKVREIHEDEQLCRDYLNAPVFSNNKIPHFFELEWILSCFEKILT